MTFVRDGVRLRGLRPARDGPVHRLERALDDLAVPGRQPRGLEGAQRARARELGRAVPGEQGQREARVQLRGGREPPTVEKTSPQ